MDETGELGGPAKLGVQATNGRFIARGSNSKDPNFEVVMLISPQVR
jgi:hypothetical protein